MTIAITGGNGEFGKAVLAQLSSRGQEPLIATVRDMSRISGLAGIDYRPGNFDDPRTLAASLAGVDTVLINAGFFGADPSLRLPRVSAAIAAATKAGVDRIVLTSWANLDRATISAVQNYRELEAILKAAGPAWTILRMNTGMADILVRDIVWGRQLGELVAPAKDAYAAPAAITDLATASAIVLADQGYSDTILELTGPDKLGWDDLAKAAGVPFRPVSDEEYIAVITEKFALPSDTAKMLAALYGDFRDGRSTPTTTLADLLGRKPLSSIEAVIQRVPRFSAR